jgi:hypothetical protein
VPHLDAAVLTSCQDDGQLRVEGHSTDVVRMALQGVHTRLGLVVPHLQYSGSTFGSTSAVHQ